MRLHDELEAVEEKRLKAENETERIRDYLKEIENSRGALQTELQNLHNEVSEPSLKHEKTQGGRRVDKKLTYLKDVDNRKQNTNKVGQATTEKLQLVKEPMCVLLIQVEMLRMQDGGKSTLSLPNRKVGPHIRLPLFVQLELEQNTCTVE